ncbi:MAG: energy-coupling factor transporter transmembrane protein EcfT [Actinomycetia bacterium]|nr:energy-coupling factor transporter transmembrane protein EcfT [Actinomycetes bacterium]
MNDLAKIDARIKIVVLVVLIVALTLVDLSHLAPLRLVVLALAAALVMAILSLLLGVSPLKAAWTSCIVLPFAGGVALFSPLAQMNEWSWQNITSAYLTGWPLIFDILFKAYAATFLCVIVMQSMSIEDFIEALSRLRIPSIFIMLFTFLYRFTDLFREQLRIMRDAARSRAPHLHGWRLLAFYGRMSGNMFIRAYERGEQIYSAMLSRGYDGTLPRA